jgi:hypothetical protein
VPSIENLSSGERNTVFRLTVHATLAFGAFQGPHTNPQEILCSNAASKGKFKNGNEHVRVVELKLLRKFFVAHAELLARTRTRDCDLLR